MSPQNDAQNDAQNDTQNDAWSDAQHGAHFTSPPIKSSPKSWQLNRKCSSIIVNLGCRSP